MWLEHWYLVWKLRWGSNWWCDQEMPHNVPDKDETHTFHSFYCGRCDFGHHVGIADSAQAMNQRWFIKTWERYCMTETHSPKSMLTSHETTRPLIREELREAASQDICPTWVWPHLTFWSIALQSFQASGVETQSDTASIILKHEAGFSDEDIVSQGQVGWGCDSHHANQGWEQTPDILPAQIQVEMICSLTDHLCSPHWQWVQRDLPAKQDSLRHNSKVVV